MIGSRFLPFSTWIGKTSREKKKTKNKYESTRALYDVYTISFTAHVTSAVARHSCENGSRTCNNIAPHTRLGIHSSRIHAEAVAYTYGTIVINRDACRSFSTSILSRPSTAIINFTRPIGFTLYCINIDVHDLFACPSLGRDTPPRTAAPAKE